MLLLNSISAMDCLAGLRALPSETVQCCVTSPPYFHQRDYGVIGQIGMENSPEEYVNNLALVFDEIKRVLKKDGTCWLNLGDTYWGSGKAGNNPSYQNRHTEFGKASKEKSRFGKPTTGRHSILKNKDLIGIPWMVAFALRAKGWWLRQEIIWHKMNAMPESTNDRCTRSHEHIFMLSKSSRYYYNAEAIKVNIKTSTVLRKQRAMGSNNKYSLGVPGQNNMQALYKPREKVDPKEQLNRIEDALKTKANRRSVWVINTKNLKEAHYASYPLQLPDLCIKAGSKEKDIILDPFMGSGTTALAAALLNRYYIGFELNQQYVELAKRRLRKKLGLFYTDD